MPPKSIPEPWRSFLSDIDAAVGESLDLHCLGDGHLSELIGRNLC